MSDMSGFVSALDSEYIIDGVRMDLTPRQILEEASGREAPSATCEAEPIVDESVDPAPDGKGFDSAKTEDYLKLVSPAARQARNIPLFCPEESTRAEIALALTEIIWKAGHFRLGDLILSVGWVWDSAPVGNMAAFYRSVEAACGYLDMLGVRIGSYAYSEKAGSRRIKVNVVADNVNAIVPDEDAEPADIAETIDRQILNTPEMNPPVPFCEFPFRTESPVLEKNRKCQVHVSDNAGNWLIYIPFDTCKFRLGGSLLAEKEGLAGGKAPEVMDSDYFMDCFEVVREFVEDGVVVSGTATGHGGLICALDRMASRDSSGSAGIDADLSGLMQSYGETDMVKVLFGEVPGVVMEIRDIDFDYVDAEMLLQDVAYYPIGHPGKAGLRITRNGSGGIAGIMQALMGQGDAAPEGED